MKKYAILIVLCLTFIACGSACKAQDDFVCPSGEGLTEEECNNAGTHTYQSTWRFRGWAG